MENKNKIIENNSIIWAREILKNNELSLPRYEDVASHLVYVDTSLYVLYTKEDIKEYSEKIIDKMSDISNIFAELSEYDSVWLYSLWINCVLSDKKILGSQENAVEFCVKYKFKDDYRKIMPNKELLGIDRDVDSILYYIEFAYKTLKKYTDNNINILERKKAIEDEIKENDDYDLILELKDINTIIEYGITLNNYPNIVKQVERKILKIKTDARDYRIGLLKRCVE